VITGNSYITNVKEDASGTLNASDVDNPATFQVVSSPTTTAQGYGTYTMDANGHWTYQVNQSHPDVQALNNGDSLMDTFTVSTADGTQKTMTMVINKEENTTVVTPTPTLSNENAEIESPNYFATKVISPVTQEYFNYSRFNYDSANTNKIMNDFQVMYKGNVDVTTVKPELIGLTNVVSDLQETKTNPTKDHLNQKLNIKLNENSNSNADNIESQKIAENNKHQSNIDSITKADFPMTIVEKNAYTQQMNFEQKIKAILRDFGLG
ncbi:MAG: VCBS domain-containing protein, partial [Gammaproteobacteria bacterium]|nr:VCBS domain-containing protein [Gammaproteobacteria bacterium]